ncbi:hypothetical protein DID88_003541 [Monilinia fructigena]|uniref:Uncharacterized protein n=1 Tax=Monilinia fructigena TaxID=38457 RepID=A0A395IEN1_9HELO|nr:hypothetical protein DID88_003541 [Monilinia fructigena]
MSQEDYHINFVLESIETIMSSEKQPKVILFDIGGVCVLSPMQAILDFERANNIPPGWVNYSISRNKPNGFWHRLERGEINLDQSFFSGFTSDLHNPSFWSTFYKSIREKHSLPAEVPPIPQIDGEALFWSMMDHSRSLILGASISVFISHTPNFTLQSQRPNPQPPTNPEKGCTPASKTCTPPKNTP